MSNARHIFHEYLLQDKSVTLQFESEADVQILRSALQTYKRRESQSLKDLGIDSDLLEGKSIVFTQLKELVYRVEAKIERSGGRFKILTDHEAEQIPTNMESVKEPKEM